VEAEGPRGEVGSKVAVIWKRREPTNGVKNLLSHTPSGNQIFLGDEFPDVGDVLSCARVKDKTPGTRSFCGALLKQLGLALTKIFEEGFAIDGLYAAAFDLVIPAVEHITYFRDFRKIAGQGVFNELFGLAPTLGGEFLEPRFDFGLDADFHAGQCNDGTPGCQRWKRRGERGRLALEWMT
jgi:hypothetical protein